jgi:hypothetical protein
VLALSSGAVPAAEAPPLAVPFGPWSPDQAQVDQAVSALATNVFAQAIGYGPVPGPVPVTQPLPGPCRGAIAVQTVSQGWVVYAGTATKLYRFNAGTRGWTDISGPSPYSLPSEDYWSFALYGPTLIAVHLGAPPQEIDVESGTTFSDLGHTDGYPPPFARFVAVVNEFVFLGGIGGNEAAVQWSGIGDPHYWVPGIRLSDIQILPDGGNVTALVSGESLIVFQERAIQQFVFAGNTAEAFQRTKLESDRGAVAPWSVVKVGANIFFLDRDGFYAFSGAASQPIGKERVDRWFQTLRDPTYIETCVAAIDPTGSRVFWAFKSQQVSDPTMLDQAICYDFLLDRWTRIDIPLRYWMRTATSAISADSISEISDTGTTPYDFLSGLSSDSAVFSGGVPKIGVFGTDNALSLFEGPSLEATIQTPWAQIARPNRAYSNGVRIDSDAQAWFAAVSTRESLAVTDMGRERPESSPNAERFAPCRASGRYHQVKVRIPAGDPWTYAQAVEPMVVPEGMR